jgi:hypothetical protein
VIGTLAADTGATLADSTNANRRHIAEAEEKSFIFIVPPLPFHRVVLVLYSACLLLMFLRAT